MKKLMLLVLAAVAMAVSAQDWSLWKVNLGKNTGMPCLFNEARLAQIIIIDSDSVAFPRCYEYRRFIGRQDRFIINRYSDSIFLKPNASPIGVLTSTKIRYWPLEEKYYRTSRDGTKIPKILGRNADSAKYILMKKFSDGTYSDSGQMLRSKNSCEWFFKKMETEYKKRNNVDTISKDYWIQTIYEKFDAWNTGEVRIGGLSGYAKIFMAYDSIKTFCPDSVIKKENKYILENAQQFWDIIYNGRSFSNGLKKYMLDNDSLYIIPKDIDTTATWLRNTTNVKKYSNKLNLNNILKSYSIAGRKVR